MRLPPTSAVATIQLKSEKPLDIALHDHLIVGKEKHARASTDMMRPAARPSATSVDGGFNSVHGRNEFFSSLLVRSGEIDWPSLQCPSKPCGAAM